MYNKYRNKKIVVDGFKFDSQKEYSRYSELKLLLRGKIITGLRLQPRYLLQGNFTDNKGIKHRKIEYVADFEYIENGRIVVEDVKASKNFTTDVYKLKKKLFLYNYNYDFREIF